MNVLSLTKEQKKSLKSLISKPSSKRTLKEKKGVLELGAKDFSKRFAETLKRLSKG
jgi:hypothetical protein